MRIKLAIISLSSVLGASLFAVHSFALPSDAQAKMYISAQSAQVDKLTGDSVYIGDVTIDRGTTHVTCDKLTVKSVNGKAVLLTAYGNPNKLAHYQTKTDINKPVLDAYALVLKYYPPQHVMELIGQGHVTQGNNQINGPHLQYDVKNKMLVALKDDTQASGKTTFIIDPDEVKGSGGNQS